MHQSVYLSRRALACCLLFFGTTLAVRAQRVEIETKRERPRVTKVSALLGARVSIQDNVGMGKIEDIVLNDGCVDYLVVAYDEKYVLVPWAAAKIDFDRRVVSLGLRKER